MTDTPNGAALMPIVEFFFGPAKEVGKVCRIKAMACRKVGQGCLLGEPVPGADPLAVIAAINPIAHQRSQRLLNVTLMLNGEVGNAAPGVELVGANKGLGGAGR